MADEQYWDWYAKTLGQQPQQASQTLPQVSDWDAFYRSVGISPSAVGGAPTTRSVASVPVNLPPLPRPVPERATTIATFPTKSFSDLARGKSGTIPDRLPSTPMAGAKAAAPPLLAGSGMSGYTMTGGIDQYGRPIYNPLTPSSPLKVVVDGANPIMASTGKIAPVPNPPYTGVSTQVSNAPAKGGLPLMAVGANAPVPFNRPQAAPFSLTGLIGALPRPVAQDPSQLNSVGGSAIWGFSGGGSSGGAHGGSDNDKHRGDASYDPTRR